MKGCLNMMATLLKMSSALKKYFLRGIEESKKLNNLNRILKDILSTLLSDLLDKEIHSRSLLCIFIQKHVSLRIGQLKIVSSIK